MSHPKILSAKSRTNDEDAAAPSIAPDVSSLINCSTHYIRQRRQREHLKAAGVLHGICSEAILSVTRRRPLALSLLCSTIHIRLIPLLCRQLLVVTALSPLGTMQQQQPKIMAPPPPPAASWDEVSQHYHDHVSRFTRLFAQDLLQSGIIMTSSTTTTSTTILDIGCGPGVFGLAYLQHYPHGVDGHTIVCSDLSPGMVATARREITRRLPADYRTKFVFQVEDGAVLEGISDDSISLVVSVFGLFLIPDRSKCLTAIRRVLKRHGKLATTAWTCLDYATGELVDAFGANFHYAIAQTTSELTNVFDAAAPWKAWGDADKVRGDFLVDFDDVMIHRAIHTVSWPSVDGLWELVAANPMANVDKADAATIKRAKQKMKDIVMTAGSAGSPDKADQAPSFVWMAANMITATKR